jgi:hypothetical protein
MFAPCYLVNAGFMLGLFFDHGGVGNILLRSTGSFSGPHSIIFQKAEVLIEFIIYIRENFLW